MFLSSLALVCLCGSLRQALRLGAVAHGGNPHALKRLPLGEDRAASPLCVYVIP
ncbi:hypothetical protein [Nostoc favosum]|uniref:Uncharacterized protein n=1 Tax=Nostoc favosum CHAB5714 TaxID=2780399 RepID=A0ABS8I333_9NOSO|nr:hypothetical protein [Nostoc favosum]MCC5598598.1 hypothetical protein [Nostoc favosum CHAB5714]